MVFNQDLFTMDSELFIFLYCTMPIVYVALGSNLWDRKKYLSDTIISLQDKWLEIQAVAPLYICRALGFDGQEFYNTVIRLQTDMDSYDIFAILQDIEKELGRERAIPEKKTEEVIYSDRTIDIDVLLYDDMIAHNSYLTIPHRSMHERDFVLRPLLDLDPELCCPMTDCCYTELLEQIPAEQHTILGVIHDWYK